ncbi:MAG: acetolactate synthase large subunit [Candidatus Micrarchaeota archaeon]
MKSSDFFIRCLENEDVKYIFGLPGEEVEDVLFSIKSSNIEFVLTRHEQGAAFMADLYGRLTGKAGVCLSTLGPGATNLITGVADANLDHAPLVAITGQGSVNRLHKESHQIIDIVEMFKPVTKWNTRITSGQVVGEIVRKAFKIAQMEKPGATHIEISEDIAASQIPDKEPISKTTLRRPYPDHKALSDAVTLINQCSNPVILAGNGAIRKLASKQLSMLVEKTGIPVISTFMGKGAVSDLSAHSLFAFGLGTKKYVADIFAQSDLVICVGYDVAELDPSKWNPKKDKKIIHIDFTPSEVYENYIPNAEIVADISNTLWALNTQIIRNFESVVAKKIRANILSDQAVSSKSNLFPISPQKLISDLRSVLKEDDIVISDVGAHKMWIGANYPTYKPNTVIVSNGFASMGIALPGAIGAKLAKPDKTVVAVTGDGGFIMNCQELETAKRLKIPFVCVVLNDTKYSLIEAKQVRNKGEGFAIDFENVDISLLAKSFGVKSIKIDKTNELKDALKQAIDMNTVCLVDVPTDAKENLKLFE